MMNHLPGLARRGFEATLGGGEVHYNLPTWGFLMLGTTCLAFFTVMFMVEYTFGRLIPTLIMIESPQEAINFDPLPTEDPDSTINKDPEHQTLKPQYITSSFRRTAKHLQSVGGSWARFRGLAIYFVNAAVVQWTASIFSWIPFVPKPLIVVLAAVACAQLSLAWTHIVISEPSPKTWFRRLPSKNMWKKVALPTAIFAVAEQVTVMIPLYIAIAAGLGDSPEEIARRSPHEQTVMVLTGLGIFALGLVLSLFVVIPARVTLVRVQASLLPDTEETIVPFDRSFGGKVVPEIVGGTGAIGMLDAWKTFDWASRVRLVKAYVKVFAIQMALSVFFCITILCQLFIIVGKDFSKIIDDGDKNKN